MAVKFPLKMSGVEVRTLEELQKNFNLEEAVEYFRTGKLQRWLDDRYYEEIADKVSLLRENDSNLRQRLCEALGVGYDESSEINEARLKEKRNFLKTQTDNETIIKNADKTALNQEDLADLLNEGKSTIYLYGGNTFSIPMRKTNKHYIGILGTPKIMIGARSQAEVDEKNITFENCKLPWTTANNSTKKEYQSTARAKTTSSRSSRSSANSELIDTFEVVFGHRNVWNIFDKSGNLLDGEPSSTQKRMFLKMVCNGEYEESDLIHLCADEDFSAGWAFTKDSFCVGGTMYLLYNARKRKIFFSEIDDVGIGTIVDNPSRQIFCIVDSQKNRWLMDGNEAIFDEDIQNKIVKFLNFAKG